jgi:hypothetical protein
MSKRQSKDQTKVCKHISRILPGSREAAGIVEEIQGWLVNNGPEWTVKRLKGLKQSVINYLAFELDTSRSSRRFVAPEWFSTGRGGFPKGPLGSFLRTRIDDTRNTATILGILNTYTSLVGNSVTPAQEKKFLEAIAGQPAEDFDKNAYLKFSSSMENLPLEEWFNIFRSGYRETFNWGGVNTSKPTLGPWRHRMKEYHPWTISLIESTMVTGPWTPILTQMGLPCLEAPMPAVTISGSIQVLQERGLKARVIAMPIAGVQVAMQPLHRALSSILRSIPADCTFDQKKGIDFAQRELMAGNVVHAVDLSSATDNFPLAYQLALLTSLGYSRVAEFTQICRSQWTSDYGNLRYTKGQPMGMYGSFNLFALAHHCVLLDIEGRLGVRDTYRVLGDDVIISNDEVHSLYLEALRDMSIPISVDKCLDSDLFTEFAGKLIAPYGVINSVKSPMNDNKFLAVDSFINYARVNGSLALLSSVPKKYRDFATDLAALPVSYGGAGINPKGLSLIDRLIKFSAVERETIPKVFDLRSTLMEYAFSGNPHVKTVCSFVNDQLTIDYKKIRDKLEDLGLRVDLHPDVERSMLIQMLQAKSEDVSLPYQGTVSEETLVQDQVFSSWKLAERSIGKRIEQKFDSDSFMELN